ncbi:MAG: thiosulfate oxidation carrier protein SoxY [Burkholderiales bacterium]|jgi:sulfur-oxidizing protein SoxY|nr:thiosulfate oxidation carrier protein SoxY [Burkholderiales bacterium]MDP2399634.1 thiosulfate oxidation carrier protein SoxY [Burkholderiales bacterium]
MPDRRRFLLTSTALAGGLLFTGVAAAQQNPQRIALLREVTGGAPVNAGRVTVDTPPLADNGHSVAVRVLADSPMTAEDHVRRITLLAERNPRPVVASFTLGPHSGRAEISTRIRLADIQDVLALVQFSDGSWWMGGAHVIVTELACLEG